MNVIKGPALYPQAKAYGQQCPVLCIAQTWTYGPRPSIVVTANQTYGQRSQHCIHKPNLRSKVPALYQQTKLTDLNWSRGFVCHIYQTYEPKVKHCIRKPNLRSKVQHCSIVSTNQTYGQRSSIVSANQTYGQRSSIVSTNQTYGQRSSIVSTNQTYGQRSSIVSTNQTYGVLIRSALYPQTKLTVLIRSSIVSTNQTYGPDRALNPQIRLKVQHCIHKPNLRSVSL